MLADACESARRRLGDRVFAIPMGQGIATYSEAGSPLNKIAGLGFDGSVDESALGAVESRYAASGAPIQAEVSSLADPSVARALTGRGYLHVGVENVLGCRLPAEQMAMPSGVHVATSLDDEFGAWLDVVVSGFATPDAQGVPSHEEYDRDVIDRIMRDFSQARGVVRYLARRGDQVVGGGVMRMDDGVAQLGGAATLPAYRRQGVQTALILTRLSQAGRHGCDIAVVTTQPGSKSHQNLARLGFEVLYTRTVLVREA